MRAADTVTPRACQLSVNLALARFDDAYPRENQSTKAADRRADDIVANKCRKKKRNCVGNGLGARFARSLTVYRAVNIIGFRHSPTHRDPAESVTRVAVGCVFHPRPRNCENTGRIHLSLVKVSRRRPY